jgi:fructoselysine-6-P-deglycase FrlB-like protein
MASLFDTALWTESLAMPETLATTVDRAEGVAETAALLTRPGTRRIVATGNGAAYYCAQALWLTSLRTPAAAPEVVALPAGLLPTFAWREGDALLAVSSSGELRDVIEAADTGAPSAYAAITANADSTIGKAAAARALVRVDSQDAITHTQGWVGNVAAALLIWSAVTGDRALADAVRAAPGTLAALLADAPTWGEATAARAGDPPAAIAFGSGPGWAAALETALLLKEVAAVPTEGQETREGATSGMYALRPGHLVLSLAGADDHQAAEAEQTCERSGATVVRVPGGDRADARLLPITTFPAAVALAGFLGVARGLNVDRPPWIDAYYATARRASTEEQQ